MSAHDFGPHGAGAFLLDALRAERPNVLNRVSLSDLVHVGNAIVAKARDGMVDAATLDATRAQLDAATMSDALKAKALRMSEPDLRESMRKLEEIANRAAASNVTLTHENATLKADLDAARKALGFARHVLIATLEADNEIEVGDHLVYGELDPTTSGTMTYTVSDPSGEMEYESAEEAIDAILKGGAA